MGARMSTEKFVPGVGAGTVTSGGTTAPAAGTVQAFTVTATAAFPVAVAGVGWFKFADPAAPTETMLATVAPGGTGAGQAWTVTRGADGTTPVAHAANFTVYQVVSGPDLAALAAAPALQLPRVFFAGHSYTSGYQNTEGGERFATRLAAAAHAEEVTYAVTSAVLAQDNGGAQPGGYASVLNAITPRTASGASYAPRSAAPYLPLAPASVYFYGFNDLAYLTSTVATNVAWFKMALRACACLSRAGGYFPDTHASVAYGGSGGSHWTANTGTSATGSPTNHSTSTANDTVTITVPADFPGGEINILTQAKSGGTKWSTVVDSGSPQVLDGTSSAFGSNSGRSNLVVQRLTGLAAGTHTIVMTMVSKDSAATAVFDSWLVAAPQLPLTVLCTQPAAPALPYSPGGSPAHTPVTSSDVTALNTAISALAGEFTDGMTVVADVAAYFAAANGNVASTSPGSLYVAADELHPNTAGHGVIAQCARDAIATSALSGAAQFGPLAVVMRIVGGPQEPPFDGAWGLVNYAWFGKDRAGNSWLQLSVVNTSSPGAGDTILTLPPGYQPSAQVLASGVAWTAGYAGTVPAALGIQPSGVVQWFSGSPAVELDVTWSWPANGLGS